MEASGPILNLLTDQSEAILDCKGRFRIDRNVLKDHYCSLLDDDLEAILFLVQGAHRWESSGIRIRLIRAELLVDVVLTEDSPVRDRLGEDPENRLSALFAESHFLYEFSLGYNVLAYSELTNEVTLELDIKGLSLSWKFCESVELRTAIWDLLHKRCTFSIPCIIDDLLNKSPDSTKTRPT